MGWGDAGGGRENGGRRLGDDIDGEVMARGLDQPGQSSEAWLAASRFVRTDDRLGHARPLGELGLGQAGPFAGGSERAGGVH